MSQLYLAQGARECQFKQGQMRAERSVDVRQSSRICDAPGLQGGTRSSIPLRVLQLGKPLR